MFRRTVAALALVSQASCADREVSREISREISIAETDWILNGPEVSMFEEMRRRGKTIAGAQIGSVGVDRYGKIIVTLEDPAQSTLALAKAQFPGVVFDEDTLEILVDIVV